MGLRTVLSIASIAMLGSLTLMVIGANHPEKQGSGVSETGLLSTVESQPHGTLWAEIPSYRQLKMVKYERALALSPIIMQVETRSYQNAGKYPYRDWGVYHIHRKTGRSYLLEVLHDSNGRELLPGLRFGTVGGPTPLFVKRIYWGMLAESQQHLLYDRIMIDKMEHCSHLGKEDWSCWHSGTRKFRLRYLWAAMKWMSVDQVGKFVNLSEYKFPPEY